MTTSAEVGVKKYYKVLVNGRSCHGGTMDWALPNGKPGKWHSVAGDLSVCRNGLHVTCEPSRWYVKDAACYEVEWRGGHDGDGFDKIAVRECRLLREVSWADVQVFGDGKRTVTSGHAQASGSATVTAYGSATVEASGSATVRAYGSADIRRAGGYYRHTGYVELRDGAACIDRRSGGTPTLYAAPWSDKPEASA